MTQERSTQAQKRRLYGYIVVGLLVAIGSVWLAMLSIDQAPGELYPGGAAPRGYTYSLILFVVPVAALGIWFVPAKRRVGRHWRPFWYTLATITGLWIVLDILLARTFFLFPDPTATLGINIPGFDPETGWGFNVPIEEVLFYILGAAFLVLTYIWASEAWFPHRDLADEEYEKAGIGPLRSLLEPRILLGGLVAIGLAVLVKQLGVFDAPGGFPGYFTFLVVIVLLPSLMIFQAGIKFINLPAFVFTLLLILLIALLWEVTLALPYGWWGYRSSQMIGLFITPWSNLPVEAAFLWAAAAWSNIAVYEAWRLVYHRKRAVSAQS